MISVKFKLLFMTFIRVDRCLINDTNGVDNPVWGQIWSNVLLVVGRCVDRHVWQHLVYLKDLVK